MIVNPGNSYIKQYLITLHHSPANPHGELMQLVYTEPPYFTHILTFPMRFVPASALLLLGFLTACAVGPDYVAPKLEAPENWSEAAKGAGSPTRLWWQELGDSALESLITRAEQDNPSLEQAQARIAQAEAAVRVERGGFFPEIGAAASATRSSNGNAGGTGAGGVGGLGSVSESASLGLNANLALDVFGGLRRALQGAGARLNAANAEAVATRLSLESSVAQNWFALQACEVDVTQLAEDARSRQVTAEITGLKAQAGFAPPADTGLAEASAADGVATLESRRSQCRQTRNALVALTGYSLVELAALLPASEPQDNGILAVPPAYALGVPAAVVAARPDIMSAEQALQAANADIGVAKAAQYPSLSLSGSFGHQWITYGGTDFDYASWSYGPALTLPLFAGGALSARVDASEAAYAEALGVLRERVRKAVQEVEDALARIHAAQLGEERLAAAVAGYERRFNATEALYKSGGSALLDLETNRRTLILARQNYTAARLERLQAWVALMQATGGQAAPSVDTPHSETIDPL